MSYTSIFAIKPDLTAVKLKKYKNSCLFLPQICKILGQKYLHEKDTYKMMTDHKELDKLGHKISKSKIVEDHILWLLVNQQIFFTKDKEFIVDCIQKFFMKNVRYYHPDNSDLIEWYAKIQKDISKLNENQYPYFVFEATSLSDTIYNMFFRFNEDTLEDIPVSLKEKKENIVDIVCIKNGRITKFIPNTSLQIKNSHKTSMTKKHKIKENQIDLMFIRKR